MASTMNVTNASVVLHFRSLSISENGMPEKPNGSMNANVGGTQCDATTDPKTAKPRE